MTMSDEQIGYAEAMSELEAILGSLDEDEVDVDALAANVERASTLIAVCRDRISAARLQVEQIVASMADRAEPLSEGNGDDDSLAD
jgi:exodeoxyribonuclease VII small subunit